ncbi:MAG: hypothetical protein GQ574_14750 [Crocinitomix sp.]|nr:hypothetical protein [Crocinitomix sp.]
MNNVRHKLGLGHTDGLLGVEIEVEGESLPQHPKGWVKHRDGSLRGAENAEYVLPHPLPLTGANKALDDLWGAFEQEGSHVEDSFRAGVHVHLNVQDLSPKQLVTLIVLYFVLEGPLTRFCGNEREGNHFCMRSSDAEFLTQTISKAVSEGDMSYLQTEDLRYSALNVTSLFKYGSLEFRAMRSTSDKNTIKDWCGIIDKLKTTSLEFDSPTDVLDAISAGGEHYFVKSIFGGYAKHFLAMPDLGESIRIGLLNAQDIAYSRDWAYVVEENLNIFRRQEKEKENFFS